MDEESADATDRMSFVSETTHEGSICDSPLLLPCLSLLTRSPHADSCLTVSDKGSPVIPVQFLATCLSKPMPTVDSNVTPLRTKAGGEDHAQIWDWNHEASQSLFTSSSITAADEGNTGDLNSDSLFGAAETSSQVPLDDAFSQNLFVWSEQGSLPCAAEDDDNVEAEETLRQTISTLCEKLTTTVDDDINSWHSADRMKMGQPQVGDQHSQKGDENSQRFSVEYTQHFGDENSLQVEDENSQQVGYENFQQFEDENSGHFLDENSLQVENENSLEVENENSLQVEDENSLQAGEENSLQVGEANYHKVGGKHSQQVDEENIQQAEDENPQHVRDKHSLQIGDENLEQIRAENSWQVSTQKMVSLDARPGSDVNDHAKQDDNTREENNDTSSRPETENAKQDINLREKNNEDSDICDTRDLFSDREWKGGSTLDSAMLLDTNPADENQRPCSLSQGDLVDSLTEIPLWKRAENAVLSQACIENESAEQIGDAHAIKRVPDNGNSGKYMLISNKPVLDVRVHGDGKHGSNDEVDSGQIPGNGEGSSSVASNIVSTNNTTENADTSFCREQYLIPPRTAKKFKVPYSRQSNPTDIIENNSSKTLLIERNNPAPDENRLDMFSDSNPSCPMISKDSVARTQIDCLENEGQQESSKGSHRESGMCLPNKEENEPHTSTPRMKDMETTTKQRKVSEEIPSEKNGNIGISKKNGNITVAEKIANTSVSQIVFTNKELVPVEQKKRKKIDANAGKNIDQPANVQDSDTSADSSLKAGSKESHGPKTGRRDRSSESDDIPSKHGPGNNSTSRSDHGESCGCYDTDTRNETHQTDEQVGVCDKSDGVQNSLQHKVLQKFDEGTSASHIVSQPVMTSVTPPMLDPPNRGSRPTHCEEKTSPVFQNILSTLRYITKALLTSPLEHSRELELLKELRDVCEESSSQLAALSAEQKAVLTQTVSNVIRDINKRQQEERITLAHKVKGGKMTSAEKAVTKQRLQWLTERSTVLQAAFHIHGQFKRASVNQRRDSQTEPQAAQSISVTVKSCIAACSSDSGFNRTQSEGHITTQQTRGTQADNPQQTATTWPVQAESNGCRLKSVSEGETSNLGQKLRYDGDKEEYGKTVPLTFSDGLSGHALSTDTTLEGQSQGRNTRGTNDEESVESCSQMSQSVLKPRQCKSKQFSNHICKSRVPKRRTELCCQNEYSAKKQRPLPCLEISESSNRCEPEKQRSPEFISKEAPEDSDECSERLPYSLYQSLSAEHRVQNFSQSSSFKKRGCPQKDRSAYESSCVPGSCEVKDVSELVVLQPPEDGGQPNSESYRDKIKSSLDKNFSENGMEEEEQGRSPARSFHLPTVCDEHEQNTLEPNTQPFAGSEKRHDVKRHTAVLVSSPTKSDISAAMLGSPHSAASNTSDSTVPPECESMIPDSTTGSQPLFQSRVTVVSETFTYQPATDTENGVRSALVQSAEREVANEHEWKSKDKARTLGAKSQASNVENIVEKKISSPSYKRLRNSPPSRETASDESVLIVHVSPKTKSRKTDINSQIFEHKSPLMTSSSCSRKANTTGQAVCGNHAEEMSENNTLSSQNKQANVEASAADRHQSKVRDSSLATLAIRSLPQQEKTTVASFTIHTEEKASNVNGRESNRQSISSEMTVQKKQKSENQTVVYHKSLISHKFASELPKKRALLPLRSQAMKPQQAAIAATWLKPVGTQKGVSSSVVRSAVPIPPTPPSQSSSKTSMTGVFPVSSQDILRKMTQHTSLENKKEAGLQDMGSDPQPENEVATTSQEINRMTVSVGKINHLSRDSQQLIQDEGASGNQTLLESVEQDIMQKPMVCSQGSKQTSTGTGVIVQKKLPQSKSAVMTVLNQSGFRSAFLQLLRDGLIHPGDLNLSFYSNGSEKRASILADGRVQDDSGLTFASPVSWYRAVKGISENRRLGPAAYAHIRYGDRTLAQIKHQADAEAQQRAANIRPASVFTRSNRVTAVADMGHQTPPVSTGNLPVSCPVTAPNNPTSKPVLMVNTQTGNTGSLLSKKNPEAPVSRENLGTLLTSEIPGVHIKSKNHGAHITCRNPERQESSSSELLVCAAAAASQANSRCTPAPEFNSSTNNRVDHDSSHLHNSKGAKSRLVDMESLLSTSHHAGPVLEPLYSLSSSAGQDSACMTSSSSGLMIASLRKLQLIEDNEVVPDASSPELISFWAADFTRVTLTPKFWATLDDWN